MLALIGQADSKKVRTYISVKDACKISGYRVQYLRRLLRQKKLSRRKIGQVWLIELSSLESYLFLPIKLKTKDLALEQTEELVSVAKFLIPGRARAGSVLSAPGLPNISTFMDKKPHTFQ